MAKAEQNPCPTRQENKTNMKESVLTYLRAAQENGAYRSGSEIAAALNTTRANVWKYIRQLTHDGYPITGITGKGYRLESTFDYLDATKIAELLTGTAAGSAVTIHQSVPSTNALLKEAAQSGAPHGTTIIAETQTAGRGRLGRSFFSPDNSGLYISILVRPQLPAQRALFLTTATAVAAAEVIEQFGGRETQIKWVNDVYIGGKKCAGILTEASVNLETGILDWAVIGIGVNCFPPFDGFPPEIADRADSVFREPNTKRSSLAAALISAILDRVHGIETDATGTGNYIDEYRRRSYLTGKQITILSDPPADAFCRGIDDSGALLAVFPDGTEQRIAAGDVSVKPQP